MIDKLGSNGGGFIAGYYGDVKSLAVEPEWQQWADMKRLLSYAPDWKR